MKLRLARKTPLTEGFNNNYRFYFVHSYHCIPEDRNDILFTTDYGYPFVAAIERDNIIGVQFHPEKKS